MKLLPILLLLLLFSTFVNAQHNFETRPILDGDLEVLLPTDFTFIGKEDYKSSFPGEPAPDESYYNKDRSVEITFVKLPRRTENLRWCKAFSESAFLTRASSIHFNDTLLVNGATVHLTEFESIFKGKKTYVKMFFMNLDSETIMGGINFDAQLKEEWVKKADAIFTSIKEN